MFSNIDAVMVTIDLDRHLEFSREIDVAILLLNRKQWLRSKTCKSSLSMTVNKYSRARLSLSGFESGNSHRVARSIISIESEPYVSSSSRKNFLTTLKSFNYAVESRYTYLDT